MQTKTELKRVKKYLHINIGDKMLDWVATILTITSFTMITYKIRYGFIIQVIAAFFWIAFGLSVNSSAVIFINLFMMAVAVKGWIMWSKEVKENA